MGSITEDILDGLCCEVCGVYFVKENGFPCLCEDCYEESENRGSYFLSIHPEQ